MHNGFQIAIHWTIQEVGGPDWGYRGGMVIGIIGTSTETKIDVRVTGSKDRPILELRQGERELLRAHEERKLETDRQQVWFAFFAPDVEHMINKHLARQPMGASVDRGYVCSPTGEALEALLALFD